MELAPGLHRWTAPHPDWRPARKKDSSGDWPRDVGCLLVDLGEEVALIDPLVQDWAWLDDRVAGRPVHVLTTISWHKRDREAVLERYRADREVPAGIEAHRIQGARETVYWLPAQRALVPGDTLIADDAGGVRMCPESWLGFTKPRIGHAELRERLAPLLELPVERVLVSHGAPVLGDGHAALARALGSS